MKRILTLTCFFMLWAMVSPPGPGAQQSPRRELAFAQWQDPGTLDPHLAGDVVSSHHAMLVYESLLEFDPFDHAKLRPCLAAAMPSFDAQTQTYTFKLRDDVYFADDPCFAGGKGRKLVASDLVYSFKRLAALPQLANFWIVEGFIAGLDEFGYAGRKLKGEAWNRHMAQNVEGLGAPDDRTFVVKLVQPCPQFLYVATMSYTAAVAREACETYGEALGKHPVGTGPFVLRDWKSGLSLSYERNANYRDVRLSGVPSASPLKGYEGMRLPLSDAVRFEIIEEGKTHLQRCLEGRIDRAGLDAEQRARLLDPNALALGRMENLLVKEFHDKGLRLTVADEPMVDYIAFNMCDETVGVKAGKKGKAIRKALALCMDRARLNLDYRGGFAPPANELVPPDIVGHGAGSLTHQRFDAEEAREVLRKAGFRVEQRLTKWRTLDENARQVSISLLLRSKNSDATRYAMMLAQFAEQAGIKLECEALTFAEFLKKQEEGKGQAYDSGWVMDYPDAQNVLQLLYGPYKPPGINAASFENAEYDKCYEELAGLSDQDEKQRARKQTLIKRMTEIVDEEAPWVLLSWRRSLTLYREGLKAPPPCSFNYALTKYTVKG